MMSVNEISISAAKCAELLANENLNIINFNPKQLFEKTQQNIAIKAKVFFLDWSYSFNNSLPFGKCYDCTTNVKINKNART